MWLCREKANGMTEREFRLRSTIDRLRNERDYFKARAPKRRVGMPFRCIYCGLPTRKTAGTPVACPAHRDLLSLDPLYVEMT